MTHRVFTVLTLILLGNVAPVAGQVAARAATARAGSAQATDSAAVVGVVDAFHRALETGDTAAVRGLLAEQVTVQEGGGLESRSEYLSHHLPGDMAFAAAIASERRPVAVEVRGDVAWVVSTSRRTGTFRDRAIDMQGAELMVLTRDRDTWRIAAIHWSSRSRP
jgi:ketosteroid isomerase-like protein